MAGVAQNWRVELVLAHPALFHPPAGDPIPAPGFPDCGPGWRDLLARCCVRIEAALTAKDRFEFQQIQSRYGSLHVYWGGQMERAVALRAREAVNLAEAAAECTCECCGDEGALYRRGAWLSTRCTQHADGRLVPIHPGYENLHLVQRFGEGRVWTIACARYDRQSDAFIDVDPSSLSTDE
jgi:hypothetical protein